MGTDTTRLLVIAGVISLASPAAAQLVSSGGFESANPAGTGSLTAYDSGITLGGGGWTAVGPSGGAGSATVFAISGTYAESGVTFNTSAGGNAVALDLTGAGGATPGPGATAGNVGVGSGVTQTLTGLDTSTPYTLSFQVGRASDGTANGPYGTDALYAAVVGLTLGGGPSPGGTFTNSTTTPSGGINWESFDYTFTPTGSTVTFTFTNQNLSSNYTGLDNVSLTPVPEPAAGGLLASAGLGVVWLIRRRCV